jgi:hypothetical protein
MIDDSYSDDYTYEYEEFYTRQVETANGKIAAIQFHDTKIIHSNSSDTTITLDGYMIVFSVYMQASFSVAQDIIEHVMLDNNWNSENHGPIILVAHDFNLNDQMVDREVTHSEIAYVSNRWNIDTIEVNSKTGGNINDCLQLILQKIVEYNTTQSVSQEELDETEEVDDHSIPSVSTFIIDHRPYTNISTPRVKKSFWGSNSVSELDEDLVLALDKLNEDTPPPVQDIPRGPATAKQCSRKRKNILCLDGGGMRGKLDTISLYMLILCRSHSC